MLYPLPDYAPSRLENTLQYSPPEVLFNADPSVSYWPPHPPSYDLWSVGVLSLELLLGGTRDVFRIDERVRARVEARVEDAMAEEMRRRRVEDPQHAQSAAAAEEWLLELRHRKENAVLYRSLLEYGISPETDAASCSDARFQQLLRQYDPMHIGAPNIWMVKLIRVRSAAKDCCRRVVLAA
jgi:serine/threonine protein kinase